MRFATSILTASVFALAACADNQPVDPNADINADIPALNDMNATANAAANATAPATGISFTGGDGATLGSLTAADSPAGLVLTLAGAKMPPGTHGLHLHVVGKCEGPKFESAGAHLNPANKQHGTENPNGSHKGDLPNAVVAADGALAQVLTLSGMTLADLKDADGTALVVHASSDDNKTDPSGNSGDRIACAVIAPAG